MMGSTRSFAIVRVSCSSRLDLVVQVIGDLKEQLQKLHMLPCISWRCLNVMDRIVSVLPKNLSPIGKVFRQNVCILQFRYTLAPRAIRSPQIFKADVQDTTAFRHDAAWWVSSLQRSNSMWPKLLHFLWCRCGEFYCFRRGNGPFNGEILRSERTSCHGTLRVRITKRMNVPQGRFEKNDDRRATFRAGSETIGFNQILRVMPVKKRTSVRALASRCNMAGFKLACCKLVEKISCIHAFIGPPIKNLSAKEVDVLRAPRAINLQLKRTGGVW